MMRINRNIVIAGVIFVGIVAWVASGSLLGKHPAGAANHPPGAAPAAEGQAAASPEGAPAAAAGERFEVRARVFSAEPRAAELVIRGRTEAVRSVTVKSETAGLVTKLHVEKGAEVKEDDIICELAPDARLAQLAQAQASMKQAELEHQAATQLAEKGYRSETQVVAAKAVLDAAKAAVRASEIELERTRIRAPFDGVVDDRMVEVGDYVQPGGECAKVVDLDPILVVGMISERDVGQVHAGDPGHAVLITGEDLQGKLRFVGTAADPATRTFRVELEVPNAERAVRDGVTADIRVPVKAVMAHKISPAILGLDENGVIGVRTVDAKGVVAFVPVTVIADASDGVWISGLPDRATVITVGQEFVVPGETVEVAIEGQGAKS